MSPTPQQPEEPAAVDPGPPTEPSAEAVPALPERREPGSALAPDVAHRAGGEASTWAAGKKPVGFGAWRGRLIGAVTAVVLASTATTAALQWRAAGRLAAEKAERGAVSARAREFATALQTYDYSNLQAYRDQVLAISDENFEKTYNEAFSPLERVITSMKASSSALVRGVYVSEIARGRAKAITVVDSQVTSTAGTRRMLGTYMELGLVKTGDQWKVNDATVMGAADELVTDPHGKAVEPAPGPSPSATGKDG
ncbi:hypothetical protein [Streptosporangium sp. NPDC087985]|uniref:hypothetical protein n=1 Tax=Streptosporangium sp. NPDC087985 TaxID=3366196 RepID=UPI0037F45BA2